MTALRGLRRRELARTAAADVLGVVTGQRASQSLSVAADVVLAGALRVAQWVVRDETGLDENPTRLLVVAMGRWGGEEMGYSSDADVLFVHDPVAGADPVAAQEFALAVASRLRSLLGTVGPEPTLEVDADLRPEGRNGPLVRSFDSYAEYYERWSAPWESQALLRARPGRRRRASSASGSSPWSTRCATRRAASTRPRSARSGASRRGSSPSGCPRGVDPARHLKLGRGGISDVEWTAQLLQLQHAHRVPALRTTATLDGARGGGRRRPARRRRRAGARRRVAAGVSRLRDANVLWTGRGGSARGRAAARPAGARRARPRRRLPAGLGWRARAGLPAHRPAVPRGRRAGLLRLSSSASSSGGVLALGHVDPPVLAAGRPASSSRSSGVVDQLVPPDVRGGDRLDGRGDRQREERARSARRPHRRPSTARNETAGLSSSERAETLGAKQQVLHLLVARR